MSIKVTLFYLANCLGTLAKQPHGPWQPRMLFSWFNRISGCDVHIDSLIHPTVCQSCDRTQLKVMSTSSYNPVRSAIILTIAFLLPLLLSVYSDRLTNVYSSFWSPGVNSAGVKRYNDNTTIQSDSSLARQQTVRSHSSTSTSLLDVLKLLQEHASQLLQDIRRDTGEWNSNHPRWRLMNSMRAYLRYGEERTSELDIWRKRYKKLPRSQRSV
jgi:hypothetical protein